jgi:polar amino acid transport system substrate-binding protein
MERCFQLALTLFMVVAFAPSAHAQEGRADSELAQVKARGKLVMLCFPVQGNSSVFVNLEAGPMRRVGTTEHFKGTDVELMALFSKELGVTLEIRPVSVPSYAELIPALLRGEGNVIASSFSITEERRQLVDFSIPYAQLHAYVFTRKASGITSPEDLLTRVGTALHGSNHYEHLRKLGVPESLIKRVEFPLDGYRAVESGEADYGVIEASTREIAIANRPGFEVVFELGVSDAYGVAIRKGSDLKAPLDAFITKIKASGEYEAIQARYREISE